MVFTLLEDKQMVFFLPEGQTDGIYFTRGTNRWYLLY